MSLETPSFASAPTVSIGLRRLSVHPGNGWELATNPLGDLFMLGNLEVRKNIRLGNRLAAMAGLGGFHYFGNTVTTHIAHLLVAEIKETRTKLQGARLFAAAGITMGRLELHWGTELVRINGLAWLNLGTGIRWKPGRHCSLGAETVYCFQTGRCKPGLGVTLTFGSWYLKLGLVYNPVNDPAVYIPVIPVADTGIKI